MDKKSITIYDVAREAGVSMATVSRVVNGNPNVKPSTRKKVSEVIDRLNYRPNAVARGLASKKTTTVGVIIPNVTNSFFSSLARGIDDIATMYKYNIILANSDENTEKEVQVFNTLLDKQVDGIIFMGNDVDEKVLDEIKRTSTPVVFAGTVVNEPEAYTVNIDYAKAVQEVTSKLLEHGRKTALVTGPSEYLINQERVKGFKAAYDAFDQPFDNSLIIQRKFTYKDADEIVDILTDIKADGVVVDDDSIAATISNKIQDNGISIPNEFEIISCTNSMITELVRPKLSCTQLPLYDIGAVAMRLLTKIMNSEKVDEKQVILPHKYSQRGTTKNS